MRTDFTLSIDMINKRAFYELYCPHYAIPKRMRGKNELNPSPSARRGIPCNTDFYGIFMGMVCQRNNSVFSCCSDSYYRDYTHLKALEWKHEPSRQAKPTFCSTSHIRVPNSGSISVKSRFLMHTTTATCRSSSQA